MGFIKSSHPPYTFTEQQYDGLLGASMSATIISLLASFAGLVMHFLLLWYDNHRPKDGKYNSEDGSRTLINKGSGTILSPQPGGSIELNNRHFTNSQRYQYTSLKKVHSAGTMNRVSLRLIVVACLSYSVYSVAQLVVTGISENVLACRVLAYFIICFDVLGSICLGLVGFNLVMVFVVNVRRPERLEKYYYAAAIMISIFVFVPPLILKAGRTIDKTDSCWYHFFFEGRAANHFNWLYYYSWLLFASILASVSSIIAIRKVMLEKNNFAHTINMLNREELSYPRPTMHAVLSFNSTNSQNNTISTQHRPHPKAGMAKTSELFRRVAIRCICYALVPVLCKSWGIGIEIAITSGIVVNYPILVIDRFMACIMGFFVSCIYFSDPSVQIVWQDMMTDYKKRYVDQFYYVDVTKVVRLDTPLGDSPTGLYTSMKQEKRKGNMQQGEHRIYTIINYSAAVSNKRSCFSSHSDPTYIYASALRRPMMYRPRTVFRTYHGWCCFFCYNTLGLNIRKEKARWVAMRRVDDINNALQYDTMIGSNSIQSQNSIESIEPQTNAYYAKERINSYYKGHQTRMLEPYPNPIRARLINLFFAQVMLYRPPYYHKQKQAFKARQMKGKDKSKVSMHGAKTASEKDQEENLVRVDNMRHTNVPTPSRLVGDYATTTMAEPVKTEQLSTLGADFFISKHNQQGNQLGITFISDNKTTNHEDQPSPSLAQNNTLSNRLSPCPPHQEHEQQAYADTVCKLTNNENSDISCMYTLNLAESLQASTRIRLERIRKAKECQSKEISTSTAEKIYIDSKLPLKGRKPDTNTVSGAVSQAIRTYSAPSEKLMVPPAVGQDDKTDSKHRIKWRQKQYREHQHHNQQCQSSNSKQYGPYERNSNQVHRLYRRHFMNMVSLDEHMKFRGNVIPQYMRNKENKSGYADNNFHPKNISGDGYGNENDIRGANLVYNQPEEKRITQKHIDKGKGPLIISRSSSTVLPVDHHHSRQEQQFNTGEGLSPPSKRHYASIYRYIVVQKPTYAHASSELQMSDSAMGSRYRAKAMTRNKEYEVSCRDDQFHCESVQEIMFSGVRTVLLSISNNMNIYAKKEADNQQLHETNRITVRIYAWVTDFTINRLSSTPDLIHYL